MVTTGRWKRLCEAPRNFATHTMTVRVLDFYADWCGPCKKQDPILEDLEAEYGDVDFQKIDVDEEQDLANQYQVRSLPTVVVEQDGDIVDRFVGFTQREDIEAALQQAARPAGA
ncbi:MULTISPECIES: thioredoxin [Halobellus]|uniref:thioredoxin n=2 Tax=Haloferacaceae TaxID=1644056 RepID=UPI0031B881E7